MSVLEVAKLSVKADAQEQFEAAFVRARGYLEEAEGHLETDLSVSTASETAYVLLVRWRSIEDHIERFAASSGFDAFRDLLWGHFEAEPDVRHYQEMSEGTE